MVADDSGTHPKRYPPTDPVTRDQLKDLLSVEGCPCVSLFHPTSPVGPDSRTYDRRDPRRLKNLLRTAREDLRARGVPRREVETILARPQALLDEEQFWQYQANGLALFAAPELFRFYRMPLRLETLCVVANRFHTKPLLPLLTGDGLFYVLALSQNAVRLLEATRDSFVELELGDIPSSLGAALRYDDPEPQLQYRTAPPAQGGRRAALFHGHGRGVDDVKTNLPMPWRRRRCRAGAPWPPCTDTEHGPARGHGDKSARTRLVRLALP
jgi:hypothetical protein